MLLSFVCLFELGAGSRLAMLEFNASSEYCVQGNVAVRVVPRAQRIITGNEVRIRRADAYSVDLCGIEIVLVWSSLFESRNVFVGVR